MTDKGFMRDKPSSKPEHKSVSVIDAAKHSKCELCGKQAELRPYGPNGEFICFDCGMENEHASEIKFSKFLNGGTVIIK